MTARTFAHVTCTAGVPLSTLSDRLNKVPKRGSMISNQPTVSTTSAAGSLLSSSRGAVRVQQPVRDSLQFLERSGRNAGDHRQLRPHRGDVGGGNGVV